VIRSDDRVERSFHRSHENSVGRKRPRDLRFSCSWREEIGVLIAKSSAVSRVRIERTQRDARLENTKPHSQIITGNSRRIDDRFFSEDPRHVPQCDMCRSQHDTQWIWRAFATTSHCSEHHRDLRAGKVRKHFGVPREIVAAGQERRLVYRCGDHSVDLSTHCHLGGSFDSASAQLSSMSRIVAGRPFSNRFVDIYATSGRANQHQVRAPADPWVCERLDDYLRSDSAWIARRYGNALRHTYNLRAT
jgi:hypothetical protein